MMGEFRESPLQSGLNELEKTFQECKTKLQLAEQEARDVRDLAWRKADAIISGKQREAQEIADELKLKARQEADRIILEAKNKAAEIEKEAENKIKKEAKDRVKRETEKIVADTWQAAEKQSVDIIDRARKEAENIIGEVKKSSQLKVVEESDAILDSSRHQAKKIYEESMARVDETSKLIVEVTQKAEDIFKQFKTGFDDLTMLLDKAKDNLETRSIMVSREIGPKNQTGGSNSLNGRKELIVIPPYNGIQIKKLGEFLKQIPGIKIDSNSATEENFSMLLNLFEPVPLINMLLEMSLVESSDVKGDTIRLRLKPGKNGS